MLVGQIMTFLWKLIAVYFSWNGSMNGSSSRTQRELNFRNGIDGLTLDRNKDNSPVSKDVTKMGFYLYPDPRNPNFSEILILGNESSVKNSRYRSNSPLIVLIHGYRSNIEKSFTQGMKKAFLENFSKFQSNLVAVDWGILSTPNSSTPDFYYPLAASNVPRVAQRVSAFIQFLVDLHVLKGPDNVQLIGFSLGAHVAGVTGQIINGTLGQPIARITGLDPAAPGFYMRPPDERLDKTDASFVDVYHTNKGMKGYGGLLGHVDFYPNGGGPYQPGCSNATELSDIFTGTCSHARSFKYFATSVYNSSIMACSCMDTVVAFPTNYIVPECKKTCQHQVVFGQFCPKSARGIYYLKILHSTSV